MLAWFSEAPLRELTTGLWPARRSKLRANNNTIFSGLLIATPEQPKILMENLKDTKQPTILMET